MSSFNHRQKNLQVLSDLIQSLLGVDVFFLNEQKVAMAGTGSYRINIGTKRPATPYLDIAINECKGQVVSDARYTTQCYRCEYRLLCPYVMVMCHPIATDGQVKGLIGFLGFSNDQRSVMIERSPLLSKLSQRLDHMWASAGLDVSQFLRHSRTTEFINCFDEGLILTSPDYCVLNMNNKAEHLLRTEKVLLQSPEFWPVRDMTDPKDSTTERFNIKNALWLEDFRRADYPISNGTRLMAHLIVVAVEESSRKYQKRHPLASPHVPTIVGTSQSVIRLREQISCVARSDSTVLILGETGAGKELVARHIHQASRRSRNPLVTVNCAAIPDSLFESELFGYAPGAFTGASNRGKAGKFQMANGGTIFLDEVGRLSLDNQAKILRILGEGELQRLGDNRGETVDVRVLAATNINLEEAILENRFLKDLYYRLAVISLCVPPLRQRVGDIPQLTDHFLREFSKRLPECDFLGFSPEVIHFFEMYAWPGNVRELSNTIEYVMNMVRGKDVTIQDLPLAIQPRNFTEFPNYQPCVHIVSLAEKEQHEIRLALRTFGETTQGKRRAAQHLGVSLSTLYRRISQWKRQEKGANESQNRSGRTWVDAPSTYRKNN